MKKVSNKFGREDLSIPIPNPCIWENSLFHILLIIETNFRKIHVVTHWFGSTIFPLKLLIPIGIGTE